MESVETRALWAADIERRLALFDAAFIVDDEGVTAEAIHRRLVRAGRNDLAVKFRLLASREQLTRRATRYGGTTMQGFLYESVACPFCGAPKRLPCTTPHGLATRPHRARIKAAKRAAWSDEETA